PTDLAGRYTLTMLSPEGENAPEGNGFGAIVVKQNGVVSVGGTLADNMRLSRSANLSIDGEWPFYAPLYKGTGSVLGWLTFVKDEETEVEGSLNWIKTGTYGLSYTNGFTNEL